MKRSRILLCCGMVAVLGALFAGPLKAQDAAEAQRADEFLAQRGTALEEPKAQELPPQDESTLARRIELAEKMHTYISTRDQVDNAIRRSAQAMPSPERENFISAMSSMLNYNAIERISVDAMAETFTVEELEVMVDYYSKPETAEISRKTRLWGEKVQPEITRMIDKAMMRVRMGAPQ